MAKRTATIAVFVLTLSLCAFAQSAVPMAVRPSAVAVPEPGSLLVFGTGLLLGFQYLRRKLSVG